jgi:predicted metal-binding membrane protein
MNGFLVSAAVWQLMMTVMMAPTALPWLRAARQFSPAETVWAGTQFASGYFLSWLPFSAALAVAQLALAATLSPATRALILLGAGVYQFLPIKSACLRHCRNPVTQFLGQWDNGPRSLVRMGLDHGLICLGCCWALMATALALGMMNYAWMLTLALVTFAEQTLPEADWLRPTLGGALCLGAILIAVAW